MFYAFISLIKIPGNKKILRKYPAGEKSEKKEISFALVLLIGLIIAINLFAFIFL